MDEHRLLIPNEVQRYLIAYHHWDGPIILAAWGKIAAPLAHQITAHDILPDEHYTSRLDDGSMRCGLWVWEGNGHLLWSSHHSSTRCDTEWVPRGGAFRRPTPEELAAGLDWYSDPPPKDLATLGELREAGMSFTDTKLFYVGDNGDTEIDGCMYNSRPEVTDG